MILSAHEVVGDQQATALLRRTYREPWRHPEPADYRV
jgi:hypothetical protein